MTTTAGARADEGNAVALEVGVGAAVGAGAFLGAYYYGKATHPPTYEQGSSENLPERRGLAFGAIALVVVTPPAVIVTGHALNQRGTVFGGLFGAAAGTLIGGLLFANANNEVGAVLGLSLPLVGTVIGYNVVRDTSRKPPALAPTAFVSRDLTVVGISGPL